MPFLQGQRQGADRALIAATAMVVAVLSILPIARLLWEVVAPRGQLSAAALSFGLSDKATFTATWHTLAVGFAGTVVAVVLGSGAALLMLTDVRARSAFVLCFVTPLVVAPQVTALAWLQLFGPASPVLKLVGLAPPLGSRNPLQSAGGIALLLGVQYGPLVFLMVRAGLRHLPSELVEAALAAGAGRPRVLRTIILPLMTPSLAGAAALAFVSCVGNFGIPAFLGIPANYLVLPTLIYQKLAGAGPGVLSDVSFLSMLIGIIAMAGILAQDVVGRRRDYRIVTVSRSLVPFDLGRARLPVEAAMWLLIVLILVLPLLGLLLASLSSAYGVPLTAKTVTPGNYAFVLFEHEAAHRALLNSTILALGTGVFAVAVAVPIGYLAAWRRTWWTRVLDLSIELPYALPGVVLAIAALLLFLRPLPLIGFRLYDTLWIILYAYLARFTVLAVRPTVAAFRQIDRALEEAAQVAGARLFTRLRTIVFPLVAPATIAGALLIVLTSFSELTVSALLWSSGAETVGVVIFSFEQGGDSPYAAALSMLTVVLTFALMLASTLLSGRLPAGVLPWRD